MSLSPRQTERRQLLGDLLVFFGPIMSAGASAIIIVRGNRDWDWRGGGFESWFYWLLVALGIVIWFVGFLLKPGKPKSDNHRGRGDTEG